MMVPGKATAALAMKMLMLEPRAALVMTRVMVTIVKIVTDSYRRAGAGDGSDDSFDDGDDDVDDCDDGRRGRKRKQGRRL